MCGDDFENLSTDFCVLKSPKLKLFLKKYCLQSGQGVLQIEPN